MSDTHNTDTRAARNDDRRKTDQTADKARADEAKAKADAEKKNEEVRKLVHEREVKAAEDAYAMKEAEIKAAKEAADEKAKEDERLAKLTPEQRAAEVTPFAATTPSFPTLAEPHHATEFVLSEANGHRSRGNAYLADPATVTVGQPLKKTAEATANQPATYVLAAAGADCHALALYSGGTLPGAGLRIAVLVRDAEVNGNLITWGSITAPEQAIGITTLLAQGIVVRL
jgi:hypothetical protein